MKLIRLLPLLLLYFGCNNSQFKKPVNPSSLGLDTAAQTFSVSVEDPAMNLAISKARKTLTEFDKAFKSGNPLYTDFAVKKRYVTPDGGGEHMWIAVLNFADGKYTGFVNNDAEKTTEVSYGDTVIVHQSEVTDWMYLDRNSLRGGFTIRLVLTRMTKEERTKMVKDLGFKMEE